MPMKIFFFLRQFGERILAQQINLHITTKNPQDNIYLEDNVLF